MSSHGEITLPATRRTRKSIGGGGGRSPSQKAADKENATLNIDMGAAGGTSLAAGRKKSRSKSIGPGGIDVLKSGTGNRRVSLAVPSRPPPRSILKPTMPLLPEIPTFKPRQPGGPGISGVNKLSNPFDSNDNGGVGTKVALRTEEEQQAAARDREERERAELEKEIKDRREARRKSLANRRVSFAAEATLHTFHEVEFAQDSTTSTDSTRRASSAPSPALQEQLDSDPSEPPSTPPEHIQESIAESPSNQRVLHQNKRRRSSGAVSLNYNTEDDTMNSTVYDSDLEHADDIASVQGEEMTGSSDDSDEEDGTMMTVEEMTSASVASARSGFSDDVDSTGTVDENLRLAVRTAATQRMDDDEEEEAIAGFAGWGRKNPTPENATLNIKETTLHTYIPEIVPEVVSQVRNDGSDMEMTMDVEMDMDMTNAVGGILRPKSVSPNKAQDEDEEMDMSMDVTKALGGIITKPTSRLRRKSVKPSPQQSLDDETVGEQTMEFTMAVGGIQHGRMSIGSVADTEINEDMSMELTTALGDVLVGRFTQNIVQESRRGTILPEDDGDEPSLMEMTTAVGRILPPETVEEQEDETVGMDMTMGFGGIIKPASAVEARSAAKKVMEQEADAPDPSISTSVEIRSSPRRRRSAVTSEHASSSAISAFRDKGLRRSPVRDPSPTAKSSRSQVSSHIMSSPPKTNTTPRRAGPANTPPSMIGSSSPLRDATPIVKTTPRSPSKSRLFHQDPTTGASAPRVVLTPRRLSGLGVDRPGLGSPRVAEIIDRRESIGNVAETFTPVQVNGFRRVVAFSDPRAMEAEIDSERREEEEKENSRRILELEADGSQEERDATLNLREMIQGLSPKKNPFQGRKSLHIGSAKGLLGKRPTELDEEEEAEERDGVKRLKGHQGSPVKNIKLQSPPSKAETTTGRKTRSSGRTPEPTGGNTVTPTTAASPNKATTPRHQGRFMNVGDDQPTNTMDFDYTGTVRDVNRQYDDDDDGERIHLQDFLNMTSIRFMELTTAKRRHTIMPNAPRGSLAFEGKDDVSLEKCVVAGACTVPMLELYQHSCRELKKYISEGRRIVRDIETETFEENPPLFREYMSASPEFKMLMDNQFKNVKSHARLLSKAMWYEWRMKLQEGLKDGLVKIAEGMDNDDKLLAKQEQLLASVLSAMMKQFKKLEQEHDDLEAVAQELAECDPEDLRATREELVSLGSGIAEKTKRIEGLRRQVEEYESGIETLAKRKQQCLDEIREADKVREECRGWSSTEISALKSKVDELERQHGWTITGISGTTISMSYKREIELVYDVTSFQQHAMTTKATDESSSMIDLWYIGGQREQNLVPSTPDMEFFLQRIRDHVRGLPRSITPVKQLLSIVAKSWDKVGKVAEQIRFLGLTFPTTIVKTSDASICVELSLLLVPLKTRVQVVLGLHGEFCNGDDAMEVAVEPDVRVLYGESFNVAKMREFLVTRLAEQDVLEDGHGGEGSKGAQAWSNVLLELHRRLLARGAKKQQQQIPVAAPAQ
ncbi:hypothetical protein B0H66DRAFT_542936 [Apodospora peruviana]|uniref:Spc7 kinetochore protein domain-containing protein n=1 Tax=Apodospora peruviana TaxID=516989 RepID=A0AAE0MF45_9PEZI|nr:hypothetical protein B0H66DRAFT_542936 [Apodospora peruviana]